MSSHSDSEAEEEVLDLTNVSPAKITEQRFAVRASPHVKRMCKAY